MAKGLQHSIASAIASAFLLVFFLNLAPGLANRPGGLALGVCAAFVINRGEVIWWQQPMGWIVHQALYCILYFVIAVVILGRFTRSP